MKRMSYATASLFAVFLSCVCIVNAKERSLTFEDETRTYQLTYDDSSLSTHDMRDIALLSPYMPDVVGSPFNQCRAETIQKPVDKWLTAPQLESCKAHTPGCFGKPSVPNEAFLRNAEANLETEKIKSGCSIVSNCHRNLNLFGPS